MPAKIIFIAATVVVVAGIVAYENRSHVYDFVNQTRRKVKTFVQEIGSQRESIPMASRGPYSDSDDEDEYERDNRYDRERSTEGYRDPFARGFGSSSAMEQHPYESQAPSPHVRHRGQQFGAMPQNPVVFDAATESSRTPTPQLLGPINVFDAVSRRDSTETLQPENPLPQILAGSPILSPNLESLVSQPSPELSVVSDPFVDVLETQEAIEPLVEQQRPASSRTVSSGEDQEDIPNSFENPYWSVHEWASTTLTQSPVPSIADSAPEEVGQPADDVLSDFGSDDESVGSWTEVGSSVSGDDN